MKKKMLSVMLVLTLAFSCISASASGEDEYSVSEYGILQTEKDGSYITTVSEASLNAIRAASKNGNNQLYSQRSVLATEIEQSKEVLRAVGYDDEDFMAMGDDEVNYLANNAESMVIIDTYYRINEDGNVAITSLDEYNNAQVSLLTISENDATTSVEVEPGWFHITTSALYLDPDTQGGEAGWYIFTGNFEWLSIPDYRMIDAASLGFNVQLQWSNSTADFWSTRTYVMRGTFDETGTTYTDRKEYGDVHVVPEGMYCEWSLPDDVTTSDNYPLVRLTSFDLYLRGKARIGQYNVTQGFTVYSRYEHVYSVLSLNPGFSWDGSVFGISANPTIHSDSNTYTSHCGVHYDPSKGSDRG